MELKTIESKKNKMIIEVKGADHTLLNILVKQLWEDSAIKAAAYDIEHPLVGVPKLLVETTGDKTPKKAVIDAVRKLQKENDKFRQEVKEEF